MANPVMPGQDKYYCGILFEFYAMYHTWEQYLNQAQMVNLYVRFCIRKKIRSRSAAVQENFHFPI